MTACHLRHHSFIKREPMYKLKDVPKANLQQSFEDGSKQKAKFAICDGLSFEGTLLSLRESFDLAIYS